MSLHSAELARIEEMVLRLYSEQAAIVRRLVQTEQAILELFARAVPIEREDA